MISTKQLAIVFIIAIAIASILLISGCTSPTPTPAVNATATPAASPTAAAPQQSMTLSTTTSMQDSGLLSVLLPPFEKENNVNVKVVAQGSGAALKLGETGDADVLIVHSPAAEKTFVDNGFGWNKTQFAYNYFVIVGPASDPAGIKNMTNASQAFKKIYDNKSTFVGRGDNSGTANKELALWNATGYTAPNNQSATWYKSTGAGMGDTLRMADQLNGYTLSDKSTYLQMQKNLSLVILVDATPDMINKYDVIEVNATMHPTVKYDLAHKFHDYLIRNDTQTLISQYGKDTVGQPLFFVGTPK